MKNNLKVLYFGNPFIKEDSLAVNVAKKLKKEFPKIEFIHIESTFQLMDLNIGSSLLLDVADSIRRVSLINTSRLIDPMVSTTHDFDLGFFLNLTGKSTNIIAIPKGYSETDALNEVREIIKSYLPNSP